MARTPSIMIPLGSTASTFNLPEPASGTNINCKEIIKDKGMLVMFICNHCPYVIHIEEALIQLGLDYADKDIGIAAINSNDVTNYPDDSPEKMALKQYPFYYLFDQSQSVAKAYDAACTPDFFLFNGERQCVYRGQFDDSRPQNNEPVTGKDLRQAMNALLNDEAITEPQKASLGCNIKWKAT